jgi:hypothetical protein
VATSSSRKIPPASGKLGVLCVGLGAVSSTFIAGVENARRGLAQPVGSLTQMGTIRLGKRTEGRTPLIREFVPLATLEDLVFAAWDPVPDDAYTSCLVAGVLDRHEHVEPIADFLKGIKPMPAVFDQHYVKRLTGTNVKQGKTKRDLAEALRQDIRTFKEENGCDRLVIVWCASTEIFIQPGPTHPRRSVRQLAPNGVGDNDVVRLGVLDASPDSGQRERRTGRECRCGHERGSPIGPDARLRVVRPRARNGHGDRVSSRKLRRRLFIQDGIRNDADPRAASNRADRLLKLLTIHRIDVVVAIDPIVEEDV